MVKLYSGFEQYDVRNECYFSVLTLLINNIFNTLETKRMNLTRTPAK